MSEPADISVVVTNYNTGRYLGPCLDSLRNQDLDGRRLEMIVVDNDSFQDQEPFLRPLERRGVRVWRLDANYGHGGGCNRGFAVATGAIVFLVNSDTIACPGALLPLIRYLEDHADVAFVEPRTFLDPARAFLIPEIQTPTPWQHTLAAAGRVSSRVAAYLSLRNSRQSMAGWRATEPVEQRHLTGAFLGVRRDVFERFGGFDEGYPLYYEDSDLFARVRRVGMTLRMVPSSEVIHLGHRSVALIWEEAIAKSRIGRRRYLGLHHGRIAQLWDRALEQLVRCTIRIKSARPRPTPVELGEVEEPPRLHIVPPRQPYLFEVALDPLHQLSCGRLTSDASPTIPMETWTALFPTTYYLRALDLDAWRPLGAWSLTKT